MQKRIYLYSIFWLVLLVSACSQEPSAPPDQTLKPSNLSLARYWSSPEAHSTLANVAQLDVAINSKGDAMLIWAQNGSIYTRRFSPPAFNFGSRCCWETPVLIETMGYSASHPQVVLDNQGNAMAVWEQNGSIYANRYTNNGSWGTARLIENRGSWAREPQLAVDGQGNVRAVWTQSDGVAASIYSNTYTALIGSWSLQPSLLETSPFAASSPIIAMNTQGKAAVIWKQGKMSNYTPPSIYASVLEPGEGWTTVSKLDIDSFDWWIGGQEIGIDDQGNVLAVWYQSTQKRADAFARRYSRNTAWEAPVSLYTTNSVGIAATKLSVQPSGNAIAVIHGTGSGYLATQRYYPTTGWSTAHSFFVPSQDYTKNLHIGLDKWGSAVAIWEQIDHSSLRHDVFANSFNREYVPGPIMGSYSYKWGQSSAVESGADDATEPVLAVYSGGDAISVWVQGGRVMSSWFSN